jgi:hypothetical protein
VSEQNRQLEEDVMAKYLILIYESEQVWENASEAQWQAAMAEHGRFAQQVPEQGGKILGGEALQPTSTATTIRGDVVTDGPFVETKEALGGYYVVTVLLAAAEGRRSGRRSRHRQPVTIEATVAQATSSVRDVSPK